MSGCTPVKVSAPTLSWRACVTHQCGCHLPFIGCLFFGQPSDVSCQCLIPGIAVMCLCFPVVLQVEPLAGVQCSDMCELLLVLLCCPCSLPVVPIYWPSSVGVEFGVFSLQGRLLPPNRQCEATFVLPLSLHRPSVCTDCALAMLASPWFVGPRHGRCWAYCVVLSWGVGDRSFVEGVQCI